MEREAQKQAEVYGCEYGQIFLRQWFRLNGCPLCGSGRSPICHLHHVMPGQHGRKAHYQVPLCPDCHRQGDSPGNSFREMERERGIVLIQIAKALASAGESQGYLPVECCDECGKWHSTRFLVDDINRSTGELRRRLCERCAPEGPP